MSEKGSRTTRNRQILSQAVPVPQQSDRYTTCADAALFYTQHEHLPVFPLNGKIPFRGTRGFKEATTNEATIRAWWQKWPIANVGLPTGEASGWLVLDVDARTGGFESLQLFEQMARHRAEDLHRAFEPWPTTRTALTGGEGLHLIYAYPHGVMQAIKNTVELAGLPGLDVRGEGGYIVVAPSRHISGRTYLWANEGKPAPMPELLTDLLMLHHRQHQWAREVVQEDLQFPEKTLTGLRRPLDEKRRTPDYWLSKCSGAQRGTRHKQALFLACRLVEYGIPNPEQTIREYVQSVPGGDEDYPLSDALKCLEWAQDNVVAMTA